MARKRMIDPSIWQSENFGKLSVLAKIVFIGLFSLADDEGRGRANPTYLKSSIFPYEESMRSADIEKALSEISSNMSVVFYSCDGNNYYSLYNWDLYQTINRPTPSKIPQFDKNNKDIHVLFSEGSVNTHGVVSAKRKEENRIKKEENRNRKEEEIEIMKLTYNSLCTNLPKIQKITQDREKSINKFLKEFTIEQFKQICQIANSTDFLIGNNDRKWTADFDFLMRIDKATNILEGKYSNSSSNKSGMNDFVDLWKEAQNDEKRNNTDNSSISGEL